KRRSWENSIVLIRRKTRASARGGPAYSSSYYLREQAFTVLFPQLNVRNGSVAMTRVRTPSITAGTATDFPFSTKTTIPDSPGLSFLAPTSTPIMEGFVLHSSACCL